jgi:hypothetical protein
MNFGSSFLGISIASLVVMYSSKLATAGSFDGWCFKQDDCGGPYKIEKDAFGTCESYCRLTEPTKVNGMDGLLYNVVCEADHLDRPSKERMLMMRYKDYDGKARALAVGKHGPRELIRCGR